LRIVFMGTPGFAVPSLEALAGAGHDITLVVTQPDRPSGRGRKLSPPPVKLKAAELGIDVYQPERVKRPEAVERLAAERPDVIVVAAFGQILPKSVLDIPPKGCLNVHASILPRYRGAAPINWAIIRGENMTGVTIMQMDVGMDTGGMLMLEEEHIRPDDTAGTLTERLAGLGAKMVVEALERLDKRGLQPVSQDESKATYAPMLKKEIGRINWGLTAAEIERLVRGLDPWPGAYTTYDGEQLRIWRASAGDTGDNTGEPGEVLKAGREGISVATGGGVLLIIELQGPGGRRMPARDYLAGHRIAVGERLGYNAGT
jgi:methionyl-tRNA formyltransferase